MKDVVMLEDHKMFSITFSRYLQETHQFGKITCFEKVDDLLRYISFRSEENIVIILDYFLPDTDIDFVIKKVRVALRSCKILIITSLSSPILLKKLISLNLAGIISKLDSPMEVVTCLNDDKPGRTYLSVTINEILSKAVQNPLREDLTKKETEILKFISQGKKVDAIANELNLSKHTVVTHRRNILAKSEFHSISDLIVYLVRNAMI
jgi:DNA-binding NarL/FixJ family response regulator